MACFLVPAAEAVVTTILTKVTAKREAENKTADGEIRLSKKLGWLNNMLWGGSALLAFEHLWHGELVPVFPFLTGGFSEVFTEMATVGVAMAAAVTAVWGVMVAVTTKLSKRADNTQEPET